MYLLAGVHMRTRRDAERAKLQFSTRWDLPCLNMLIRALMQTNLISAHAFDVAVNRKTRCSKNH